MKKMLLLAWGAAAAIATMCVSCQSGPGTGFVFSFRAGEGNAQGDLFELIVVQATMPLDCEELRVGLQAPGQTELLLPCELARDANNNGMLDTGDVLRVAAPVADVLALVAQNTSLGVTMLQPFQDGHKQLWAGTWQPPRRQ